MLLSVASNSSQPFGLQSAASSVCGISQARILEWVAISSSKGSSTDQIFISSICALHQPSGKPLLDDLFNLQCTLFCIWLPIPFFFFLTRKKMEGDLLIYITKQSTLLGVSTGLRIQMGISSLFSFAFGFSSFFF